MSRLNFRGCLDAGGAPLAGSCALVHTGSITDALTVAASGAAITHCASGVVRLSGHGGEAEAAEPEVVPLSADVGPPPEEAPRDEAGPTQDVGPAEDDGPTDDAGPSEGMSAGVRL